MNIKNNDFQFAVIGNPVKHSLSPLLHNHCFEENHLKYKFSSILIEDISKLKETILSHNLLGVNITHPFKEVAFEACDKVSKDCTDIGAVNTIIVRNDKLFGYNTDGDGFLNSIRDFNEPHSVLIIGAGGASKAISHALDKANFNVDILNRSKEKLEYFTDKGLECFGPNDFLCKEYDLVINATSAGFEDNELPAPKSVLRKLLKHARYAVDIIYNKKTPFLKLCDEYDIVSKDGKDMLIEQAVLAHLLFIDYSRSESEIRNSMKDALDWFLAFFNIFKPGFMAF